MGDKYQYRYEFSDVIKSWNFRAIDWTKFTDIGCGGIKYKDDQGYHNTYLICYYRSCENKNTQQIAKVHEVFGSDL